jgi:hypothetical protein
MPNLKKAQLLAPVRRGPRTLPACLPVVFDVSNGDPGDDMLNTAKDVHQTMEAPFGRVLTPTGVIGARAQSASIADRCSLLGTN